MRTRNLMIAFAMTGFIFSTACADTKKENVHNETEKVTSDDVTEKEAVKKTPTIVGVAAANEDFSTLVAAVKAAGLVETLSADGPFTVFAPVNAAFDKLPEGTVAGLLKPESKDALTSLLTYHVVTGKFMAADVVKAINDNNGTFSIPTVQGGNLIASMSGDNVILTDESGNVSTIIMTDVAASNGVIHAIDSVVMPK
ncbi:fasciclin domain-containing protein [Aureibaculum sp. A20]|uniref:Fasciclin domain-containing protein n=1 Tax=Aureibaculum flavum TaxID=2795986 RepID=A0ABS0WRL9_9FLAO|nr:fasciclin domain-containing protein [Aureibaculum flavum]MBJ2174632.1 fasciclin domain-containing protein [Aureibaculum flavum]